MMDDILFYAGVLAAVVASFMPTPSRSRDALFMLAYALMGACAVLRWPQ